MQIWVCPTCLSIYFQEINHLIQTWNYNLADGLRISVLECGTNTAQATYKTIHASKL